MKRISELGLKLFGRRLTIFPKIILALLVIMIPMDILNFQMNQSGVKIVRQEILQSSASNVHFYLSSLETEINRIVRLEREYISSDDDFRKAGVIPDSMDDYEKGLTILRIENKLSILKSSSPYIEDIKIYFPRLGRTIWTTTFSGTVPDADMEAIQRGKETSISPFTFINDRLVLGMIYPSSGQEMFFTIEVELSVPLLRESLAQMSNKHNSGSMLLNESELWQVSDQDEKPIASEIRTFLSEKTGDKTLSGYKRVQLGDKMYLLYYERSASLGLTLVHYVPESEAMGVLNSYQVWYVLIVLASLIFVVIFSYGIFLLIHKPMRRLVNSLYEVGKGNLSIQLRHRYNDEFQDVYLQFNTMVSRIHKLIGKVSEQQSRLQRSELKQLQSQINPHFLYNSLFVLLSLIKQGDLYNSERLVMHMGNYFRNMTRNGEDEVGLDKEFSHAKAYAGIQSVRFPDITTHFDDIPGAYKSVKVPRLILQPLVENAYLHGLEELDGKGMLHIKVSQVDGSLEVSVEDNGHQLTEDKLKHLIDQLNQADNTMETTGIFNVHRRLQLKYGREWGLQLALGQWGGMRASFRIPLSKED